MEPWHWIVGFAAWCVVGFGAWALVHGAELRRRADEQEWRERDSDQ